MGPLQSRLIGAALGVSCLCASKKFGLTCSASLHLFWDQLISYVHIFFNITVFKMYLMFALKQLWSASKCWAAAVPPVTVSLQRCGCSGRMELEARESQGAVAALVMLKSDLWYSHLLVLLPGGKSTVLNIAKMELFLTWLRLDVSNVLTQGFVVLAGSVVSAKREHLFCACCISNAVSERHCSENLGCVTLNGVCVFPG